LAAKTCPRQGIDDLLHRSSIRHVGPDHVHRRAVALERLDDGGCPLPGPGASEQGDAPGAAVAEPASHTQAEAAESSRDQDRAVGVPGELPARDVEARIAQHDLAGMASLGHRPEGRGRARHRHRALDDGTQLSGVEHGGQLPQRLADRLRLRVPFGEQVVDDVADVGPDRADLVGRPDVALADFDEAAARPQQSQAQFDERTRQAVEDDVDTLAPGGVADHVGERRAA
jgi:hypothetical protein